MFSVSLAQGGPAPRFLRPWCFDYLSAGDLDESTLTIDDVDDAELYDLIKKVRLLNKSFISVHAHHLHSLHVYINRLYHFRWRKKLISLHGMIK